MAQDMQIGGFEFSNLHTYLLGGLQMYLKKIHSVNVGPIEDCEIEFAFSNDNPKPVVIVGENGTGKSALLSNIVDSFYEIASKAFNNARAKDDEAVGQQYYKILSPHEIHSGKKYMYSYLEYEHNHKIIHSIFKSGHISSDDVRGREGIENRNFAYEIDENYKGIDATREQTEDIFSSTVICYFGPDRYEKPNWMGQKYHNKISDKYFNIESRFNGRLDKPILVKDVNVNTLQWLLNVIADSRCDIEKNGEKINAVHVNINEIINLGVARANVERIMSEILGREVFFGLNYRNFSDNRFNIKLKTNGQVLVPSFEALSTGQSALFNLFSTIIRYADAEDITKSIDVENIAGIVVIDEVDLHLHAKLQKEILPKLLHLFPKVQFIISTHAPLFLLGMDEIYGEEGYDIYQMPSAQKISSERFTEFQRAYSYLEKTEKYHKNMLRAIQTHENGPLVITEGATDWKHMKAALKHFHKKGNCKDKYTKLDFDFLEYEPDNSPSDAPVKIKMSNSDLCAMCEQMSKLKQSRKIIFIADADHELTNKKLGGENGEKYKKWGNNVFSFILPIPDNRRKTPGICIEHYYTDEVIKTEIIINGVYRRLYMGNEFNDFGVSWDHKKICKNKNSCGENKISIIEGDEKSRVYAIDDDKGKVNLALSKMEFANGILEEKAEFRNADFDNFQLIFDIIDEILNEPMV